MCYVSDVNCHMSLTHTATAIDPPPANSPIMHSRLVRKDSKIGTNFKTQKIIETTETHKWLDVCQFLLYALSPEVSSSLGSGWLDTHMTFGLSNCIGPEG